MGNQWNGSDTGLGTFWNVVAASAPFWLVLGGLIGLLLPRPKWLEASGRSGALLYVTPPGLFFRRAALFFHGALIAREIWTYFTLPGSFTGFWLAVWNLLCGRGFTAPQQPHVVAHVRKGGPRHRHSSHSTDHKLQWYVDEGDLQFFKDRIEKEQPPPGVTEWEPMMNKDFGDFTYTAWRRSLPDGKTEYKSVTIAFNATAEEFMDFYFDDNVRPNWDSMISETEVLENGPGKHRCQVVRWVRSFPFAFISKREYVIGRRMFQENGCLYGITKAIEHPRALDNPSIVRMDNCYSMWRSRTIPDPKGSSQPACETVLLHQEQFKIPENMARFAVRHGMAGFVKKLGPEVKRFVAERRQRCMPFERDPDAFGVNTVPNPPARSERASAASTSCSEIDDTASEASGSFAMRRRNSRRRKSGRFLGPAGPRTRTQQIALAAVATGLIVAFGGRARRKH